MASTAAEIAVYFEQQLFADEQLCFQSHWLGAAEGFFRRFQQENTLMDLGWQCWCEQSALTFLLCLYLHRTYLCMQRESSPQEQTAAPCRAPYSPHWLEHVQRFTTKLASRVFKQSLFFFSCVSAFAWKAMTKRSPLSNPR